MTEKAAPAGPVALERLAVEYVPITTPQPNEYNPNRQTEHEYALLLKSIQEDGFTQPIIIDEQNVIVDGEHRHRAARDLGHLEVPVVRVQMQAAQARIATLRHNRARGTEDDALAALVIQQLDQLAALDWAQDSLLLSDQQISAILDSVDHLTPEEAGPAGDAYQPTLTTQPDSEPGGVYQLGEHRLACGDATDSATWDALLAGDDEQIQLVVTDPPYGVSYLGGPKAERLGQERRKIENDDLTAADLHTFLLAAFRATATRMQPGAAYYIYSPSNGDQMLAYLLSLRDAGLPVRQQLVWVKDRLAFGRSDYHYRHEGVLYGWKADAPHRQHRSLLEDDRTQDTVWEYARPVASGEHPTMKPVPMIERIIRNSAHRESLVADPFAGSGSTLIACHNTGRRARLIEIDPAYCDVIRHRYTTHLA